MRTGIIAAAILATVGAAPANAADPCRGLDTALSEARKQAYRPIVAGSTGADVAPAQVEIADFLTDGGWIVVGAFVPVADGEGYFFFERSGGRLRFHDVWGGMAEPSEAAEIAAWAGTLGAPPPLARCFAHRVTGG